MKRTTLCYIEKNNKYLMLYRNKKKNDSNAGKWLGVGGHIEEGETPKECALREIKEETGLTVDDCSFCGVVYFQSDECADEEIYVFTANKFEGEILDCNEGTLVWVDKDKIMDLSLWEGDRIFLKLLLDESPFFSVDLKYQKDELIGHKVSFPER